LYILLKERKVVNLTYPWLTFKTCILLNLNVELHTTHKQNKNKLNINALFKETYLFDGQSINEDNNVTGHTNLHCLSSN